MSSRLLLISLFSLFFVSCSVDFDNVYQKIKQDRIRPLEFVLSPTDNAPGDTVTIQASFAGLTFDPTTVDWQVSWDYVQGAFNGGVFNEEALAPYMIGTPQVIDSSNSTRVLEFTFVIPDSIILNNSGIPDEWAELVQYYIPDFDPGDFGLPVSTDSILMLLDSVAALSPTEQAQISRALGQVFNVISQMLTVQYTIYADIPNFKRAQGRYSCRYHGAMANVDGVYANNAPAIDSMVIFKAPDEDLKDFDPADGMHTTYSMRGDTLIIPLGGDSSYWLGVYAMPPESTMTFEAALGSGLASLEDYNNYFFYEEKTYETINFIYEQGYFDDKGFNLYKVDIHSTVNAGDSGLFWITLTDERAGEANRPRGRYMKTVPILVE